MDVADPVAQGGEAVFHVTVHEGVADGAPHQLADLLVSSALAAHLLELEREGCWNGPVVWRWGSAEEDQAVGVVADDEVLDGLVGRTFVAGNEDRPAVNTLGAQGKDRINGAPVRDAAIGQDGDVNGVNDLRDQFQGADGLVRQVATVVKTGDDDHVRAHCGGRLELLDGRIIQSPVDQNQAIVLNLGEEFGDQAVADVGDGLDAFFNGQIHHRRGELVRLGIAGQDAQPKRPVRAFVCSISSFIRETASADDLTLVVCPALGAKKPKPPAALTAATSLASVIQSIGAWMIGLSLPKISVTRFLVMMISPFVVLINSLAGKRREKN